MPSRLDDVLPLGARAARGVARSNGGSRPQRRGFRYEVARHDASTRLEVIRVRVELRDARRRAPSILHLDLDAFFASVEQLARPDAARPAGRRGRAREPRRGRGRELRGPRSSASTPRCRWRGPGARVPTRCSCRPASTRTPTRAAGDGDPARRHAAGRAALARRGVPRRRRARPRCSAPGPRSARCSGAGSGPRPGSPRRSARRPRSCWPSSRATWRSPTGCSWSSRAPSSTFLHPLPVTRLWGVGPATHAQARRARAWRPSATSRELPEATLVARSATPPGAHLHALAWNRDDRAVEPDRVTKSIGHEETFATRPHRPSTGSSATLCAWPTRSRRGCAAHAKTARTVQLKVRYGDFRTITRSHTLPTPTDLAAEIGDDRARPAARGGPRATGSGCSGCRCSSSRTRSRCRAGCDFDDGRRRPATEDRRALEDAMESVRARFGADAVGSAAFLDGGQTAHRPACQPVGSGRRTRRARARPADQDEGEALMLRIGLIGCGHIGTVHSFALRQLADAGLIDADITATYDTDPERAVQDRRADHDATAADRSRRALDAVDVAWICTWTAGHLPAVEAAVDRDLPVFCEKPLAPTIADCRAIADAARGRCRTRSGWCCATRRCSATLAEIVHVRPLRQADGARPARRPVLPDPGDVRLDLAQRRDQGRRRDAHRALDPRPRRHQLGPRPGPSRSRRTPRRSSGTRASRTRALRCGFAYPGGATASLVERLAPGARPGRRPAGSSCSARRRSSGPRTTTSARSTSRPRPGSRTIEGDPPAWIDRLHGPGGAGQAAGPVRRADQGVPRCPGRGRGAATARARAPRDVEVTALAAHEVVDGAYRSAAAGGRATAVGVPPVTGPDRCVEGPCSTREDWPMPLSEEEQRILQEIEANLTATDPASRPAGLRDDAVPTRRPGDQVGGRRLRRRAGPAASSRSPRCSSSASSGSS